jgi:predicted nuclease of restriction endonuclease-like (RecB) superfamily
MVKHNPKAVLEPPETILEKIKNEINKNNYLTALFFESSAMEGYLISLISLSSASENKNLEKGVEDNVGRLGFTYLIAINNMLANIDNKLYKNLSKFYSGRNEIAHYLIGIDFNDTEVNFQIKTLTLNGLDLIKRLSLIHKTKLNKKSNQT